MSPIAATRALFIKLGRGGIWQEECIDQGTLFGSLFDDGGDVVKKAHVEHEVGFVQYQCVQGFQRQVFALQVVHDAPRCAHDDVRAVFKACTLPAQRDATAQRHDFDVVAGTRQAADFHRNLIRQFAGGHSTIACTAKRRGFKLAGSAKALAAVLPLPVLAWAIRSLPASAAGRLAAWMGVISV